MSGGQTGYVSGSQTGGYVTGGSHAGQTTTYVTGGQSATYVTGGQGYVTGGQTYTTTQPGNVTYSTSGPVQTTYEYVNAPSSTTYVETTGGQRWDPNAQYVSGYEYVSYPETYTTQK